MPTVSPATVKLVSDGMLVARRGGEGEKGESRRKIAKYLFYYNRDKYY